MKILVVTNRIYDKKLYSNRSGVNGIALMVRDILDGVSKIHSCYVLATHMKCDTIISKNLHILRSPDFKTYFSIFEIIKLSIKILLRNGIRGYLYRLKNIIRDEVMASEFIRLYKSINPDIVNLHDLTDVNLRIANYCILNNIKVLLTCHLYIGDDSHSFGYESLKINENKLFSKTSKSLLVSFVSTGMKKRFVKDYPLFSKENIYCIMNGSDIISRSEQYYLVPPIFENIDKRKVLLCVGSFSERKNQKQIIYAIEKMNPEDKKQLCVMFVGSDQRGGLQRLIEKSQSKDNFIYVGQVSPSEMGAYYSNCYCTITTSLNESFGLTIIEGFSYGKPAILFDDLDSFDDLFDERTCIAMKDHSDECVSRAIQKCISTGWDTEYIKKYSNKFSIINVQNKYIELFNKI